MHLRHWAILIGAVTLGASALAATGAEAAPSPPAAGPTLDTFGHALQMVDRYSVAPADDRKLIRAAMDGMLMSLDAHSGYLTPEDLKDLNTPDAASFAGVGLTLSTADGAAKVTRLVEGAPAARGGVRLGDYLVAIDGASVLGQGADAIYPRLRGAAGKPVTLAIIRDLSRRLDITVTRAPIDAPQVLSRRIGDLGYIALDNLDIGAADATGQAISTLRAARLKGLVLDLRGCPGGLLTEAVAVTSDFLAGGDVVSEHGRDPTDVQTFTASGGDRLGGLPLVVLIDADTASGAEIIAAALQDHGRARIVGVKSFGEGSVQTVIPLAGGADGALKFTTAYFLRPSGLRIEAVGVTPDIVVAAPAPSPGHDAQLDRALGALGAEPADRGA